MSSNELTTIFGSPPLPPVNKDPARDLLFFTHTHTHGTAILWPLEIETEKLKMESESLVSIDRYHGDQQRWS